MTVIAYRDGVIAADGNISIGRSTQNGVAKKIAKTNDGYLIGVSGGLSFNYLVIDWFCNHRDEEFQYADELNNKYDCFIIDPNGQIYELNSKGLLTPFEAEYDAIGSGYQIALGAMFAGASAIEAVEAAICHNVFCGGPVHVLKLGD